MKPKEQCLVQQFFMYGTEYMKIKGEEKSPLLPPSLVSIILQYEGYKELTSFVDDIVNFFRCRQRDLKESDLNKWHQADSTRSYRYESKHWKAVDPLTEDNWSLNNDFSVLQEWRNLSIHHAFEHFKHHGLPLVNFFVNVMDPVNVNGIPHLTAARCYPRIMALILTNRCVQQGEIAYSMHEAVAYGPRASTLSLLKASFALVPDTNRAGKKAIALWAAVVRGSLDGVKNIISKQGDVNYKIGWFQPLDWVAKHGRADVYVEIAKALIQAGAHFTELRGENIEDISNETLKEVLSQALEDQRDEAYAAGHDVDGGMLICLALFTTIVVTPDVQHHFSRKSRCALQ